MAYAFTFEAYNRDINETKYNAMRDSVDVTVVADDSASALEAAKTLLTREYYELNCIRALSAGGVAVV